jgi:hypothetical protein
MRMEYIGWIATALFAASYFFKQPARLRQVQAGAALLWVTYGWTIGAMPVVVANVVVAAMALASAFTPQSRAAGGGLRERPSTCAGSTPQD